MNSNKYAAQLYCFSSVTAPDLSEKLEALAKAGYEGIEFCGGFDKDPDELNAIMKKAGLKLISWHIGIERILPDQFDATVAYLKALDCHSAVVPGLPGHMTGDAEAWKKTAELFNQLSEKLKPHGIKLGYHNHQWEFSKYPDGTCPFSVFFDNTDSSITCQVDIGHALNGRGMSLDEIFSRYSGRFNSVHLKPYSLSLGAEDHGKGYQTYVGEDDIPWKNVLTTLKKDGSVDWYIVELEYSGEKGPIRVLTDAINYLKNCEKQI